MESRGKGATVGKRLLGIHVKTADGEVLTFTQALSRTIIKLLPWEIAHMVINLPTNAWINPATGVVDPANAVMGPFRSGILLSVYLLAFAYVVLAWRSPQKQSLHDRFMGTVVLQSES